MSAAAEVVRDGSVLTVTQRRVPAAEVPPPVTNAPSSVFALASARPQDAAGPTAAADAGVPVCAGAAALRAIATAGRNLGLPRRGELLLQLLAGNGDWTIRQLHLATGWSESSLLQVLRGLIADGKVTMLAEGVEKHYRAADPLASFSPATATATATAKPAARPAAQAAPPAPAVPLTWSVAVTSSGAVEISAGCQSIRLAPAQAVALADCLDRVARTAHELSAEGASL